MLARFASGHSWGFAGGAVLAPGVPAGAPAVARERLPRERALAMLLAVPGLRRALGRRDPYAGSRRR